MVAFTSNRRRGNNKSSHSNNTNNRNDFYGKYGVNLHSDPPDTTENNNYYDGGEKDSSGSGSTSSTTTKSSYYTIDNNNITTNNHHKIRDPAMSGSNGAIRRGSDGGEVRSGNGGGNYYEDNNGIGIGGYHSNSSNHSADPYPRTNRRKGRHNKGGISPSLKKRHPMMQGGMILLIFIIMSICFLLGTIVILMNPSLDSSSSSTHHLFLGKAGSSFHLANDAEMIANRQSFITGITTGDENNNNTNNNKLFPVSTTDDAFAKNIHFDNGNEVINNGGGGGGGGAPPLTEEQEQEIIKQYTSELNKFPISIGHDNNGESDDWETILHPGTEALKALHGESFSRPKSSSSSMRKKRTSVAELAGLLSGKHNMVNSNNNQEGIGTGSRSSATEDGYMRVPKFWDATPFQIIADEREKRNSGGSGISNNVGKGEEGVRRYLGNYGSRLMTPMEAQSIGSRIPHPHTNKQEGGGGGHEEQQEQQLETIFIAIASYRDFQCSSTVESALSRATYPQRIRIGVVDQIRIGEDTSCSIPPNGSCEDNPNQATCKYRSQIDYLTIEADLSVGPVFARHLGHRLYRGEYFSMQSDAHVVFVKDWDTDIIQQWHLAKNEMGILSTYLSGIEDHIDVMTGERLSKSRPIMCMSDYEGAGDNKHLRHGQQPEGVPMIHEPVFDPFWAAGFSFGRGHFVVNVPYDQHLPWIFQGEEISLGLRGFSYGYDYYSPEKSVCYHYYGRDNIPMFWENVDAYRGSGELGMIRLNAIIGMLPKRDQHKKWIHTDEVKYGLGKARDVKRFYDVFGIHVEQQKVEKHLCRFVGKPMQKEFKPYLRKNGMGLDYDKITYRFVDQWKNEE